MSNNKRKCYDEWWLPSDMDNMGYIFEYCKDYCREMFGINIDALMFLNAFMNSECRQEMEIGDPKLLSQAGKDTVKNFVEYDCKGDANQFASNGNTSNDFHSNQLFWVGWMYSYIHFRSALPSTEIIKKIPIDGMLEEYFTGHEMSEEAYFSKIEHLFV